MADKTVFVADMRKAVSNLIDASNKVTELCNFYDGMGWAEADFVQTCTNTDLTATQFAAAITAWRAAQAATVSYSVALLSLKA